MDDTVQRRAKNGHLAGIALDFFEESIKTQQYRILNSQMADVRSGELDQNRLVKYAAAYTALEDLLSSLRQTEKNGFKAAKKELLSND